jgi:hypothetical protein
MTVTANASNRAPSNTRNARRLATVELRAYALGAEKPSSTAPNANSHLSARGFPRPSSKKVLREAESRAHRARIEQIRFHKGVGILRTSTVGRDRRYQSEKFISESRQLGRKLIEPS